MNSKKKQGVKQMNLQTYLTTNAILTDDQANAIDYLKTTGLALVQNIMRLKYPNRPLMLPDSDATLAADLQRQVLTVFEMRSYNWEKKFTTLSLVYNPLNATDLTEQIGDTHSGTDSTTDKETNSGSDVTTDQTKHTGTVTDNSTDTPDLTDATSKRSYDDNTMTVTDSTAHTGTDTVNDTRTDNLQDDTTDTLQHGHIIDRTDQVTYGHKINRNRSLTGRDGKTPQEMIAAERDIAEYNFYEMIADEVTDFITELAYDFSTTEDDESWT